VLYLRQATSSDEPLAFGITEAAMRSYVEATWGTWVAEEQAENHRKSFKPQTHQIVVTGSTVAGIIAVEEHPSHVQLEKLYLLPEFRRQGIGSNLLRSVVEQALKVQKPVRLRVLRVNTSAQRFYVKHGFQVTDETPERCFMERVV
jgi:ribosomal protein S18 acetylase RimI-like enzyme